ncbi:hypothetical protein AWN76_009465 [Rhodothermaceae bacterium RA]|nr:hypothetical protein AWN76_009465 [Rhodothermaceae bacterium RA]
MFVRLPSIRVLGLAGLLLLTAGCERNFMEVRPPIRVVEPDLTLVQPGRSLDLTLETPDFLTALTVNDVPFERDPQTRYWVGTVPLERGLNRLVIHGFDGARQAATDTVLAAHLPVQVTSIGVPPLPVPRGGHATTRLLDGRLLLTGGAPSTSASARPEALLFDPVRLRFEVLDQPMIAARMGHTATLLPDGRVLILGGHRTPDVSRIDDLVETAEVFDPRTQTFRRVPVEGAPIRRFWHTAAVRPGAGGALLVDLYGGRGDVRYGPNPRLGTRSDLRTLRFRNDSLFADDGGLGFAVEPVSGHTQTPLDTTLPGASRRFLVTGSYFFAPDAFESVSFTLDVSGPAPVLQEAAALREGRTRHAAALLRTNLVLISGGYRDTPETATNTTELYFADVRRFFLLPPDDNAPLKRFGHTATHVGPTRLLVIGGFDPRGHGRTTSEYIDVGLF